MSERFENSAERAKDSVPSSIEGATKSVLENPEAAKSAAADIESKLPKMAGGSEVVKESGEALRGELTPENVRSINEYVRSTIERNGLEGKMQFQLVLIDAIAKTPEIAGKFPTLCNELNRLGCLNGKAGATVSDSFAAIQQIKPALEKAGYYLNTDVLGSGDFLIPVEGKVNPSKETLSGLYGENLPNLQPVTVINDPKLEKQGYQIAGFGLLNGGNIEANLKTYVEQGRFSPEQAKGFDMENVRQATVNHEESHRVLKELYGFPNRQPLSPEEGKKWTAEGLDFVPTNTVQIDEFLAHSVGMATDKYEIMTNIGNAIGDFRFDGKTGKAEYAIGDPNGDYALLQTFVMDEVAKIYEEKGVPNFKEAVANKKSSYMAETATYLSLQERAGTQIEHLKNSGASEAEIDRFSKEAQANLDALGPDGINARADKAWNETTGDILKGLTEADYRRISEKCMAQAKKYLSQIESAYGKKQAPTASPTATA